MKKIFTIFLQTIIVIIGIAAFAFMLWEPNIEGVNEHAAALSEIYFDDPFLAYAYLSSILFFVALYQAFKLLGYISQNNAFPLRSVKAMRIIKYCAISLVGLIIAPIAYLFISRSGDDIAGGVAIGFFLIFVFIIAAAAAAIFERILQNAERMKNTPLKSQQAGKYQHDAGA